MYCRHLAGTGRRSTMGRATLAAVALVFASLIRVIAAESTPEEDEAECDDVGFSQLKTRRLHSANGEKAHGHLPAASPKKDGITLVSSGHRSHGHSHQHGQQAGHSHGHGQSHGQSHSHDHDSRSQIPPSGRRRRRHRTQQSLPSIGESPTEGRSSVAEEGIEPAPKAPSSTAGLTFIQIGSSLNETAQEFPDDDDDESLRMAPAPHPTAIGGTADAPPVVTETGGGLSVAATKTVLEPSTEQTFLLDAGTPDKIAFASLSFCMFALAMSLCAVAARFIFHTWLHRRFVKGARERAEKLKVTHWAELENMFRLQSGSDWQIQQPLNPGILMRIQGRVVLESQGSLVAPLSGQNCVMYSASVSHQRHDGIHQPVAFRSESTDFAIELSGAPHLCINVHSHDVVLFDMVGGKRMRECALSEAPDSWRAFLLAHCVAGQDASSGAALGRCDSILDFRESALMQGVEVTCIGEIARDRNGRLGLYPWRPSPSKASRHGVLELARDDHVRDASRPLWLRLLGMARSGLSPPAPKKEALVGRVMISDDPELLA